jgi:aquaporin Z
VEFRIKPLVAEFIGTFWLVLGGCGAAVFAADFGVGGNGTSLGIGFVGVSFAFGLTVLTGAYAFGHISGGHFNPAVTIGMMVAGRFDPKGAVGYIGAQLVGAVLAAATLRTSSSAMIRWLSEGERLVVGWHHLAV